jgi:hypothetical protein
MSMAIWESAADVRRGATWNQAQAATLRDLFTAPPRVEERVELVAEVTALS